MAEHDPRLAGALGARGDDVFLAELLEHCGPRQPRDAGGGVEAEDERRQRDVGDRVAEGAHVAGQPRVDEEEAGAAGGHHVVDDVLSAGAAEPVELRVEQQERQSPSQKIGTE